MKRLLKLLMVLLFLAILFISLNAEVFAHDNPEFRADSETYGFYISDTYEPVYMDNFKTISHTVYSSGKVAGYTEIQQIFLRIKGSSTNYAFIYRVVTSPQWVYCQRRVKTTSVLRDGHELANWAPQNHPNVTTGSIGVGYDKDGFSISASVDFNHSELEVISRSDTYADKYETEYDFTRTGWEYFWGIASEYMKNDVVSYGMFTFKTSAVAWVDISHLIRYTNYPNGLYDVEFTISRTY